MRPEMREQLKTEVTRKQFLQYMAAAVVMVFGMDNLISLLTGHRPERHILVNPSSPSTGRHGFGSSRFGA